MTSVLEEHHNTVRTGFPIITNLRFTDDIDGLEREEQKLANLVRCLDKMSSRYCNEWYFVPRLSWVF